MSWSCSILVKTEAFAMVELGGGLDGLNSAAVESVVLAMGVENECAIYRRVLTTA